MAVDVADESQIDVVALTGSACNGTLITSYTAGEYWGDYPERLGTKDYLAPNGDAISVEGSSLDTPCKAVIADFDDNDVLAVCPDQIVEYQDGGIGWSQVLPGSFVTATLIGGAEVVVASTSAEGCDGLETIHLVRNVAGTWDQVNQGCVVGNSAGGSIALGTTSDGIALSFDGRLFTSSADDLNWLEVSGEISADG